MTRFGPSGPLRGSVRAPGDKSISHRALLLGAMADGETTVSGCLDSADTRSTLAAIRTLGAEADGGLGEGRDLRIRGAGLRGAVEATLDAGNAGTLMRILPGWLAGQERGRWVLDGDASIRGRPVDRVALPLRMMGGSVECREDRFPPLRIDAAPLTGISYEPPQASAQVKSCLLLAGLLAAGETTVTEPVPTRDHTERMLAACGADVQSRSVEAGTAVTIRPAMRLEPLSLGVPSDISSAAFLVAGALLSPGSRVRLPGVGVNPGRTGFLEVVVRMGGTVEISDPAEAGGEPVADLTVSHSLLHGTEVEPDQVPGMIDELPLVALLACFAEGESVVRGAGELRHKESDRIETVASALRGMGGHVEALSDGWAIKGTGGLRGGSVDAAGDHRIAMMAAVGGLASADGVEVEGMGAAAISYPGFESDLAALSA